MLKALPASKWNETTAAHLLNRAGFGGPPAQIKKLAALPMSEAVAYFVDFTQTPDNAPSAPDWAKPDPERIRQYTEVQRQFQEAKDSNLSEQDKQALAEKRQEAVRKVRRAQVLDLQEMRSSWLKRMATTSRPLQEKLTLFWHGHFATSAVKVKDPYFMWRQIQTFREKGTGGWLDLLEAVATDPAMLVWLDQARSQRRHPNENFARECMELFTLGEGHYTEKDVTEAARAMTGWSLAPRTEEYIYRPYMHDDGIKTVLGVTGDLDGRRVLEIIVAQPQAARFITAKLWKFFAAENPAPELVDAMADDFRAQGNQFAPFLHTLFSSEEFYAPAVMHSQIKSPVQWLVNSVRLLQREMPPSLVATQMTKTLGQDLLYPPNVKGWDGGLSWISTNTLLARYNQAAILIMGQGNLGAKVEIPQMEGMAERANQLAHLLRPADISKIVTDAELNDHHALIVALEKRFIAGQLSEKHRQVLREYLEPREQLDEQDVRHAIHLIMSTPEYQVT